MNMTIIGATKGIGKEVLKQALPKDINMTVLVRNPSKLDLKKNINVVTGDFKSFDSVKEAVNVADIIVITVGV